MSRMKLGGQPWLRCLTLGRLATEISESVFEHSLGGIKLSKPTTECKQQKSDEWACNTVGRLNKNPFLTQDNGRTMIFETLEKGQVKVAESFGWQFGFFGRCRYDSLLWRFDWGSVGTDKAFNSSAGLKRSAMPRYASLSTTESRWMFPFAFSLHFDDIWWLSLCPGFWSRLLAALPVWLSGWHLNIFLGPQVDCNQCTRWFW